ncbi:MAG: TA system VapC family ribonuclease toxin [Acidobacteriota bacterium]
MVRGECFLLDSNVLIALTDAEHASHVRATAWFQKHVSGFATCPITQGSLLRVMLATKAAMTIQNAQAILVQVVELAGHQFWPDSVSYLDLPMRGVIGHRQVTDAYLVALARHHEAKLATLDRALAAVHPLYTILVP